ncbi:hypothetical protein Tsp_08076 [Trichinella spiralis]|uniref:hypothetical protein n=1 Tax=Trichinella spiralis TaxID=6334 RepID=UPI0001EFE110|nr:hypothetical protein Tsp_08076 [Trichinella spiralis]
MASSDMLPVNPFVYSFGGEAHDDCFPFVVSHVALVFTLLPRMLASNTFAMNEMRNQNTISDSKLFRTNELFKPCGRNIVCAAEAVSRLKPASETSSIVILRKKSFWLFELSHTLVWE